MAAKITFTAKPRTIIGKKAKVMRSQRLIPANISGHGITSTAIVVEEVPFAKLYAKVGDTGLFYLTVDGETTERPVLVTEMQIDPLSRKPLHVALRQVSLREKVTAEVPVETVGEFDVRDALVVVVHQTIEVEALPQDLPEKFEIDVSKLTAVGQDFTFNDLDYDRNLVELKIEADQMDTPVVTVQAVKIEVEPEPVAAVAPEAGAAGVAVPGAEGAKAGEAAKPGDKAADSKASAKAAPAEKK